jgi:hypothetical protein
MAAVPGLQYALVLGLCTASMLVVCMLLVCMYVSAE